MCFLLGNLCTDDANELRLIIVWGDVTQIVVCASIFACVLTGIYTASGLVKSGCRMYSMCLREMEPHYLETRLLLKKHWTLL